MKLKDRSVLITGASSGIGRAFALKAAQDNPRLLLAARNVDKLNEVKEEVEKLGAKAEVVKMDVTDPDQVRQGFLQATANDQTIDVVFNNAGLGFINNIWQLKVEEIEKMIDVNVKGMMYVAKFASEIFIRQNFGHLIMTSSLAGLITIPQWSVYVGSKWAITGFADSIRPELKQHNVQVSTLHPGAVKTEFFNEDKANIDIKDVGDAITPDEVAKAVYDAVFTDKKKIVIPQMAKSYSLLYRFLPGLAQSQLAKAASEVEYHKDVDEDEPDFSHVKCCRE